MWVNDTMISRPSVVRAGSYQEHQCCAGERERVKVLEREVKELRKANEILRLASAFFAQAVLDRRFRS